MSRFRWLLACSRTADKWLVFFSLMVIGSTARVGYESGGWRWALIGASAVAVAALAVAVWDGHARQADRP